MRKVFMIQVLLLTLIVLTTSCAKVPDKEEVFQLMYPDIAWNEEISLKVDVLDPNNLYTNEGPVSFVIYNNSSGEFQFNLDENRLIYYFDQQKEQWQIVNDRIKYVRDDKDIIVATKDDPDYPGFGFIIYTPSIPDLDEDVELRFLITGSIEYPDGEIKPAGAYADVVISPW